jgi:condensin complex subunit 3
VLAVKRKELVLREKGLVCLGLCCLIARHMALNSFQLFITRVQTAPEVLKLCMLQVAFDVLMVHEGDFVANASVGVRRFHYILCGPCWQQGGREWVIDVDQFGFDIIR